MMIPPVFNVVLIWHIHHQSQTVRLASVLYNTASIYVIIYTGLRETETQNVNILRTHTHTHSIAFYDFGYTFIVSLNEFYI